MGMTLKASIHAGFRGLSGMTRETRVLLERYQKTGVIAEIDEKFPNQLDEEDPEDEDVDENFVSNSD